MQSNFMYRQGQTQSGYPRSTVALESTQSTTDRGKFLVLVGRILYSAVFVMAGPGLMTNKMMIGYAMSHGVPMASFLVPVAGVFSFLGGLSVLLGYKARWGACALIVFLIPVTLMMHNFWAITDEAQAQLQQIMFMKNISMLGAAFLIAYFGSGPLSMDKGRI